MIKTFKEVKVVRIDKQLAECLTFLPSTVRKIYIFRLNIEEAKLAEIVSHFPYLIEINRKVSIELVDKAQLKVINPIMVQTEEKLTLRPRKIAVNWNNAVQLNNHPELFEKVECASIYTDEFNLDVLPSKIKNIEIINGFDEESVTLNRLEQERESV